MVSQPHGGKLVEIARSPARGDELREIAEIPHIALEHEKAMTLLNLSIGIYSPLKGFMRKNDYLSVLEKMRLEDGTPWTLPLLLNVPEGFTAGPGDQVALVAESGGAPLALLEVEEVYDISKRDYARNVFGTEEAAHPGVARVYSFSSSVLGGKIVKVFQDERPDEFAGRSLTPRETRALFEAKGWKSIIAFQTRNAPHLGHEQMQKTALSFVDGLFINPVLGRKKAGDFKDRVILSTYETLVSHYYPADTVVLSVLHYEMQYAGPREAIMHAIMRKNFGCTHIAIGRDHAGVGSYYPPYAAHEIFGQFPDLGITALLFREFFYCYRCYGITNDRVCPHGEADRLLISGTKLRNMFLNGEAPPREFMRPEVAQNILDTAAPFVE